MTLSLAPRAPRTSIMPYICDPDKIETKRYGDGECVSLVVAVCGLSGRTTKTWKPGLKVQGAAQGAIARGTAIATFVEGHYPKDDNGKHAAIYLSHDDDGIQVIDQYNGKNPKPASPRTIGFNTKTYRSNNGIYYYLIE